MSSNSEPSKCLLCGEGVTKNHLNTMDPIYFKWAQSYSVSLCRLLDLESSFQTLFQNSDYCKACLQMLWEIDFNLRTLNSLQVRLSCSRRRVQALLKENYKKLKSFSDTEGGSYDMIVTNIYQAIPKSLSLNPVSITTMPNLPAEVRLTRNEKPAPASVKASRKYLEKALLVADEILKSGDERVTEAGTTGGTLDLLIRSKIDKRVCLALPTMTRTRLYCSLANCSFSCFSESELKAHVRGAHEGESNPYHCDLCPLKYTNSSNLKYHFRQHHIKDAREPLLTCPSCGKKFKFKERGLLKRHEVLHTNAPLFSCVLPRCRTKQFSSSVDLKNHVALRHEDSAPVSKCLKCNLVCANPKSLRKHIKNIHCERNPALKCKDCSYIGRVPSDLLLHMTKHSDDRNFHCPECGASYKNKCSLGFHIKNVHMKGGEKKHKCSQCPMTFSQASILKKHEQSHATSKCYACNECGSRFKHIATLQAHEKRSCKAQAQLIRTSLSTRSKKANVISRAKGQLDTNAKAREIKEITWTGENFAESNSGEKFYPVEKTDDPNVANFPFLDGRQSAILQLNLRADDCGHNICDQPEELGNSSADPANDFNWINPELFGEEFASLDIFEEDETSSLISAVLPLTASNIEVTWGD